MTTKHGYSPDAAELPMHRPGRPAWPRQPRGFNLFKLPGLRHFFRWRYARLVFQLPLLLLAVFAVVDGLTGGPARTPQHRHDDALAALPGSGRRRPRRFSAMRFAPPAR